jgi:hypothetical protein
MSVKNITETMDVNYINQEIGENALQHIIIPASLREKYNFTVNPVTGDLDIEKKTEEPEINGTSHSINGNGNGH